MSRRAVRIQRLPVAPETVTVLGYKVKATDPMWSGLDLANAEPRQQASILISILGQDAPPDVHLNVPWNHPDDTARGFDSDCRYRVRPRMQPGKKWKGRAVKSVAFERYDGAWYICVEYTPAPTPQGER